MAKKSRGNLVIYVRNFVFGVEDSLVSTVGLISGVASAGLDRQTIFLTGMVLIFVEAFSMATGSFLSEESVEEYENKKNRGSSKSRLASIIMFISYFISGFIPLAPYVIFPRNEAFVISILASLASLFVLGAISSRFSKTSLIRKGLEMAILGGIAIAVGVGVGIIIAGWQKS